MYSPLLLNLISHISYRFAETNRRNNFLQNICCKNITPWLNNMAKIKARLLRVNLQKKMQLYNQSIGLSVGYGWEFLFFCWERRLIWIIAENSKDRDRSTNMNAKHFHVSFSQPITARFLNTIPRTWTVSSIRFYDL